MKINYNDYKRYDCVRRARLHVRFAHHWATYRDGHVGDDHHSGRSAHLHHRFRQHTGDYERGAVSASPVRAQHIHRVPGRGRPDGGHRRVAVERRV